MHFPPEVSVDYAEEAQPENIRKIQFSLPSYSVMSDDNVDDSIFFHDGKYFKVPSNNQAPLPPGRPLSPVIESSPSSEREPAATSSPQTDKVEVLSPKFANHTARSHPTVNKNAKNTADSEHVPSCKSDFGQQLRPQGLYKPKHCECFFYKNDSQNHNHCHCVHSLENCSGVPLRQCSYEDVSQVNRNSCTKCSCSSAKVAQAQKAQCAVKGTFSGSCCSEHSASQNTAQCSPKSFKDTQLSPCEILEQNLHQNAKSTGQNEISMFMKLILHELKMKNDAIKELDDKVTFLTNQLSKLPGFKSTEEKGVNTDPPVTGDVTTPKLLKSNINVLSEKHLQNSNQGVCCAASSHGTNMVPIEKTMARNRRSQVSPSPTSLQESEKENVCLQQHNTQNRKAKKTTPKQLRNNAEKENREYMNEPTSEKMTHKHQTTFRRQSVPHASKHSSEKTPFPRRSQGSPYENNIQNMGNHSKKGNSSTSSSSESEGDDDQCNCVPRSLYPGLAPNFSLATQQYLNSNDFREQKKKSLRISDYRPH